jgi:hypothetical protein
MINFDRTKIRMDMAQFIGWTGVVVYIAAYALLSLGWIKADRVNYHLLNVIGGVCLVIVSYTLSDMPNLFVNLAWIFIAVVSIVRILSTKKAHPHSAVKTEHKE